MPVNPISQRYPFELRDQPPEVVQAHRYAYQGLVDLNKAIAALKDQLDAKTTTTITSTSSSSGGGGVTPAPTPFPFAGLGGINDQTGSVAYTVQLTDNGIFLILGDSSTVTLTLDSSMVTPYFFFATNFGSANVTLTPTSGTINQPTLDVGGLYLIAFDGANWYASAILTGTTTGNPPVVFLDTVDASYWLMTVASGAPVFTSVSVTKAVNGIALADSLDASSWGMTVAGGATVLTPLGAGIYGVTYLQFTDTVDATEWRMTIVGGAPVFTLV